MQQRKPVNKQKKSEKTFRESVNPVRWVLYSSGVDKVTGCHRASSILELLGLENPSLTVFKIYSLKARILNLAHTNV